MPLQILVDADACPRAVKEILFRAVQRRGIPTTLVANQYIRVPPSEHILSIAVVDGPDEADDRIVELVQAAGRSGMGPSGRSIPSCLPRRPPPAP